jgi:hypothetical protein
MEHVSNLGKGQIRLRPDCTQDHVAMRLDTVRALIAALRLGARCSALTPLPHETHRARRRDPEPLRRRPARHAAFNSPDDPDP